MRVAAPRASDPGPLVLAVGDLSPRIDASARIAPTAVIAGDVEIGPSASVWYGAVLRAEYAAIRIGAETNVQDGVVVHADPGAPTTVGDRVTIGHRAVLHGCTVGDGSLVGISSTLMNRVVIPPRCLVAAGSLVLASCEAEEGWLIAGSPARPKRPLTREELDGIEWGVDTYLECAASHAFGPADHSARPAG